MNGLRTLRRKLFYWLCGISLERAAREQGLAGLVSRLVRIVPDITEQHTSVKLDNEFWKRKARGLHAFQISLVNRVIGQFQSARIVDIGDSAGTHLEYLIGLHSADRKIETLSVNPDAEAVERIRGKGLNAVRSK